MTTHISDNLERNRRSLAWDIDPYKKPLDNLDKINTSPNRDEEDAIGHSQDITLSCHRLG